MVTGREVLKYVEDEVDYPDGGYLLTGYALGTFYAYTGSYIAQHIKLHMEVTRAWILERYDRYDAEEVRAVFDSKHWVDVNDIDDVIVLGYLDDHTRSHRVLLWMDRDSSDCRFLLFTTTDSDDEIANNVRSWLEAQCHPEMAGEEREDWETISGVYDLDPALAHRVQP